MVSESDPSVLSADMKFLNQLMIPHTLTTNSAHGRLKRLFEYSREVASKRAKVIIVAAGTVPGYKSALRLRRTVQKFSSLPHSLFIQLLAHLRAI